MWTSNKNITFRKISRQDLPKLLELKSESWFGTHNISILNLEDQTKWFESLDHNPHTPKSLFLIAEKEHPIGIFKFNKIDWYNKNGDVGWDIFKEFRGKGLGKDLVSSGISFAREILCLRRLTAEILETNAVSQKCAIQAGFILEGIKKKDILKNNQYIDNQIYGLIFP